MPSMLILKESRFIARGAIPPCVRLIFEAVKVSTNPIMDNSKIAATIEYYLNIVRIRFITLLMIPLKI